MSQKKRTLSPKQLIIIFLSLCQLSWGWPFLNPFIIHSYIVGIIPAILFLFPSVDRGLTPHNLFSHSQLSVSYSSSFILLALLGVGRAVDRVFFVVLVLDLWRYN